MKKNLLYLVIIILILSMITGVFASCNSGNSIETETASKSQNTDIETEALESTELQEETSESTVAQKDTSESTVAQEDTSELTESQEDTSELTESQEDTSELTESQEDTSELTESQEDTWNSTESQKETSESATFEVTETDTNNDTSNSTEETEDTSSSSSIETTESSDEEPVLNLKEPYADTVLLSNKYANGVQAYFSDASRKSMTFENLNMSLEYALSIDAPQQVTALKNKDGHSYIKDTMDVFITMENGKTYYGSNSTAKASPNIYRFGYYYYEMCFEDQIFASEFSILGTKPIKHQLVARVNEIESYEIDKSTKALCITNSADASDPYIIFGKEYLGFDESADDYQFLKITMTADGATTPNATLFVVAGDSTAFTGNQSTAFTITNDNQTHEYLIPLTSIKEYGGTLKGIRLDVNGPGASYQIHGLELISADLDGAPSDLGIARIFNTYSDKLHQVLQVAAKAETNGIASIGFTTDIAADTVSSVKIMFKDGTTTDDIASVTDWAQVAAVGFDIKDAGIFGYILPYDGKSGVIKVTLENGIYNIIQSLTPENGTIIPSRGDYNAEKGYYNSVVPYNQNDLYMGNRIYTDATHSFDSFLYEAICEINPLDAKYINVSSSSTNGAYVGYDALRGIYQFSISGSNFNNSYYDYPQKHYNVTFTLRGDKYDRSVYIMTSTTSGALESAVLLNKDQLILPVPMEVGKNFSEQAGERNLFNINDETYGETIFPIVIKAETKSTYSVINIYQNWGRFPLKQISWIQAGSPYYHLSTGVTETNCIVPWYAMEENNNKNLNTLPDFRTMSAPFWSNQPQRSSCGVHQWLIYNDADGNHYITSENTKNIIDSYGPTYCDVKMDYISDDGKIKLTYTHTEMPQVDENRSYYEITYEILEDISIKDFRNDFQFYSVYPNNPTGNYTRIGYLGEDNTSKVVESVANVTVDDNGKVTTTFDEARSYVLGNEYPYFSFFDMDGADPNHQQGYANVAFLVKDYKFIIGGEESDASFIINNIERKIKLSLDLGEVELKKGDTFTINAILLPWGSQTLDRDYADPSKPDTNAVYYDTVIDGVEYMDKNVRDVRENSIIDPVKATAGESTATIESVFVPKVKSTNGNTAEFTLSGGHDNIAVRVYGFDKLTAPKIEEYVNEEWVEYAVNSSYAPDAKGNLHYYDGYMVHYDGDGTFSYSFIVTMENGNERKFRVSAADDFNGWPKEPSVESTRDDYLNLYVDSVELLDLSKTNQFATSATLSEDGSYVRIFGTNGKGEGYLYVSEKNTLETGHYIVVKYRLPSTNTKTVGEFQFYASTTNDRASGPEIVRCFNENIVANGEWQLLVIDATKVTGSTSTSSFLESIFVPNENDGKYYSRYLRFDYFSSAMADTDYIDLAYIGMDNSLEDIAALAVQNGTLSFTLIEGETNYTVDSYSGGKTDNSPAPAPTIDSYVHPESNYKLSDLHYVTVLDAVNGKNAKYTANFLSDEIVTVEYNGKTVKSGDTSRNIFYDGTHLIASGWVVVEGGVNKYVWSIDGGKTWNDAEFCGRTGANVATSAMFDRAHSIVNNAFTFTPGKDDANCVFQGTDKSTYAKGICADLKDHVGETVNLIFALVPAEDETSLCPIAYITGIEVVAEKEVEPTPSYNEYVKEGSGFTFSENHYASCIDIINGKQYTGTVRYSDTGNNGITTMEFNAKTVDLNDNTKEGTYMRLSGWSVAESGIARLLWSTDGGNTWHEIDAACMTDSDSNLINNGANKRGTPYHFTVEKDVKGGNFQGGTLTFDLSAYAGSTVNVILAAEPISAPDTLCILANITGVTVP